jgi:hypothetical protein
MMDEMNLLLKSKDERISRIGQRIIEKKKYDLDSDCEVEPEPQEPEIVANVKEYTKIKAEYSSKLQVLENTIRDFKAANAGKVPDEDDLNEQVLSQFKTAESAYLKYRHVMIVQNKLPFEIEEFNPAVK